MRWSVGYDLREPLPDHSSLTRIRERYGLSVFRRFFERIVEMCFETGLVQGKELYFDATKVEANASLDSTRSRSLVEGRLEEHLRGIFPDVTRGLSKTKTRRRSPLRRSPLLWDPSVKRKGERWHRETPASTVGLRRPDASSGRWFGGATGERRISG